jgi:imidazolonepropionase-like amidohydrolase
MRSRFLLALAAVFLRVLDAAAADPTIIRAASYLDVDSGKLVSPALIVVEEGLIQAVNPESLPDGAPSIDLGDLTLLPGLIDVHTHLTYEITPGWETEPVRWLPADFALRGVVNARKTLMAGFTSVRDIFGYGFADVSLTRAIDRGWVEGPRMIPSGHALSITGGHCDTTGFAPGIAELDYRAGVADGVDEVIKAVRYQIKHGAKVIKICATAGVLSFEGPVGALQYTLEEITAAVEEAHRHGVRIAAHAHGTEGIIASSQSGVDSVEHASIITDEAARILKKNGTAIVPNLYLAEAIDLDQLPPAMREKERYLKPLVFESFKRALKYDLRIVFGTDSGVFPHGENAREFALQVKHGHTAIGAIRGATLYAAELLGTPDRGQIRSGMLADLIGVNGDPLQDVSVLERVTFVMKGGRVYKQPN